MRVPGRKLALQTFRWARSRLTGGVVVLGYHRLRHRGADPFELGLPVEDFASHIAVLARRARVIRLTDAVQALVEGRMPPRSVVITFDDGYADTVHEVLPVLEQRGTPATVFVTTGSPGRLFWWDELAGMLLDPPSLPVRLDLMIRGVRRTWSLSPSSGNGRVASRRREVLLALASMVERLSLSERELILSRLRDWSGWQMVEKSPHLALTAAEIRRLSASPLIEIGAHTVSHPLLTSLTYGEQQRELAASRATLQEITGKSVTSFSYPHGDYAPATMAAVREAGFKAACCSTPDVVTSLASVYALPRLWVRPRDGKSFERWLRRWLAA